MGCAILVPFVKFKTREKHHRGVLLLVKLQAKASMGVFTFFKLYKWYQIAQRITYVCGKTSTTQCEDI